MKPLSKMNITVTTNGHRLETVRAAASDAKLFVPFMRPELSDDAIDEVVNTLRSGWLTTGPKVKQFEKNFAETVRADYAIAVNSCTAALHLAVEALGLRPGQAVLVPSMTFAATAEIVLYSSAIPILVDCDPVTANIDLDDARRKIASIRKGEMSFIANRDVEIVGIIPVHVGGFMADISEIKRFAKEFGLWIVEDAAHAFPAAWREDASSEWQMCGEDTAAITCYSFYANKTITTGEGGMAVTNNEMLAERMRLMSLHGLSHDAWKRYAGKGAWDYRIISPGYKYNLTDIAAAIGIHQLAEAEEMRIRRQEIAWLYLREFRDLLEMEMPPVDADRLHSWHLFPVRLRTDRLSISRNDFIDELKNAGIGCSVHWRPLHLHPLYSERFGWKEDHLPNATRLWQRLVSLPIFPSMKPAEINHVVNTVRRLCTMHSKTDISLKA
ncbi:MAG: DegT/DnrJ/EryC1/StrS family aminotransferase [Blastocatellia bacterium]